MADDYNFVDEDELSDSALDAEVQRQTREMVAESARLDAEAGGVSGSLGIEHLTAAEFDEFTRARSGEAPATTPAVKAALSAGKAAWVDPYGEDEQLPSPSAVNAMPDDQFADWVNRNRSYAEGGK